MEVTIRTGLSTPVRLTNRLRPRRYLESTNYAVLLKEQRLLINAGGAEIDGPAIWK